MEKPRTSVKEAYHLWRTGGRTMTGEPITTIVLLTIVSQAVLSGTVEFFTTKMWGWLWKRAEKKDEKKGQE